jgi:alkylation response protein AidB-like acyl-CoA dehydrogenase
MDFGWSDDQRARIDAAADFARRELSGDVGEMVERDAAQRFWHEGWRRCGTFGLPGLPLPRAYGGGGADQLTVLGVLEALGYACRDNGLLFSLNAHLWGAALPIATFGGEEQKKRYLPGLADGTLTGALAMTEPESGSDAYRLASTASADGDTYVLDGHKTYITNAPHADLFVVVAATGPRERLGGLSAFLVERGTPGLHVGRPVQKMGLRTAPMADVRLTGCRVPRTHMLGPEGAGMAVFNSAMGWERVCIMASGVGTMRHLLERSVAYARRHTRSGQPIGSFQAVSHRLVEMKLRTETSRLLLYQLGWSSAGPRRPPGDAALVKLHLSESLVQTSMDALHVHGALGYLTATELEREVRDALASRLYSGTSEIQRNIVARGMGL